MERFDPVAALKAIETFAITASQWVPTMFVRMLKLPDGDRRRFDLSSHRAAVHAAAPCPPDVKRHNDPAMTRAAQHPAHPNWSTLGDVGHLDDDGFYWEPPTDPAPGVRGVGGR